MIYVFDTSSLSILLKHYYPDRFPSFWSRFDDSLKRRQVVSVREVERELRRYGKHFADWAKSNSSIFVAPTAAELTFVARIFQVSHFQSMIRVQERLSGDPVADPFVIAHANQIGGCVVTQEEDKPNSSKIPTVCRHFEVPCCNLEEFMQNEGWSF